MMYKLLSFCMIILSLLFICLGVYVIKALQGFDIGAARIVIGITCFIASAGLIDTAIIIYKM